MFDPISFDRCLPVEVPVTLEGKKYTLLEKDAVADAAYKGAIMSAMKGGIKVDGKTPQIDAGNADYAKLQSADLVLLSESLYVGDAVPRLSDGTPNRAYLVPLDTVKSWRTAVVERLIKRLKDISGDEADADTPKTLAEKITELQARREAMLAAGAADEDTGLKN